MWAIAAWIMHKNFDKEFPPEVTLSVGTTEIRVTDKEDLNRLEVFVRMAERAKWERYPAERVEVLCQLTPARHWYRVQCIMSNDAVLLVDEELPNRFAVKEFLWHMHRDAATTAPTPTPTLSEKKYIEA